MSSAPFYASRRQTGDAISRTRSGPSVTGVWRPRAPVGEPARQGQWTLTLAPVNRTDAITQGGRLSSAVEQRFCNALPLIPARGVAFHLVREIGRFPPVRPAAHAVCCHPVITIRVAIGAARA